MTALSRADTLVVLQLALAADSRATRRGAAGYAALFTEDGAMEGDMGDVAGRDALTSAVARVWKNEPAGTLHLTCNAVVDDSAATPMVSSVLVMLMPTASGVTIQAADVVQRFRRTSAGWRISSRRIIETLVAAGHKSGGR